jgi:hypothetical protein
MDLNSGRVEHDTDSVAHPRGVQVLVELSADTTTATVVPGDLAPDDALLGLDISAGDLLLYLLGVVHKGAPLANIETSIFLVLATLDLDQSGMLVLVPLSPLESGEYTLGVQTGSPDDNHCSANN